MCLAVPVAVKLLHRGNKELSRNLSSYLSLAAIHNADLLAPYIQPIIDSIISGNYSLVRVLSKIYVINKEPIHDHIMALVCLLPQCDTSEKSSLLNLFALISKHKPSILEDDLHQLSDCLQHPQTAYTTMQIFLDMAHHNNKKFIDDNVVNGGDDDNDMMMMIKDSDNNRTPIRFINNNNSPPPFNTIDKSIKSYFLKRKVNGFNFHTDFLKCFKNVSKFCSCDG